MEAGAHLKFADTIEQAAPEKYKQYYLKYRQLRQVILDLASQMSRKDDTLNSRDFMDADDKRPVGQFQANLQAELKKVNQFACVKHEGLFISLQKLCDDCKDMSKKGGKCTQEDVDRVEVDITQLGEEVSHLDAYVRLNYLGFKKITQKFDRAVGVSGSAYFVAKLHYEAFCNVRFDDLLILVGLAWARWRAVRDSAATDGDSYWVPPESFIRNTSKYWVRPEQVVLLKTRILKHMPYLIIGASAADQEKQLLDPFSVLDLDMGEGRGMLASDEGAMEEAQLLSSIYFDGLDAPSYIERIHRREGAKLVRFRWYGENAGEKNKEVFVERKVHHEGWNDMSSAKERCILPQSDIFNFMTGNFDIDNHFKKLAAEAVFDEKSRKKMKSIAVEVDGLIKDRKMQPMIRTSYYRSAFQLTTSNDVRISLDTQMTLLDEYRHGKPKEPWCLTGADLLTEGQIYRFPFAILEIKLSGVPETPQYLKEILAEIGAIQVHKFSKFQHAMAFLHPQRVPILPHWHEDFKNWHDRQRGKVVVTRTGDHTESRLRSLLTSKNSEQEEPIPTLSFALAPGGEGHFLKDLDNIDPKTVFANERTLLHYTEKAIYVGTLSVFLLRREEGHLKLVGAALTAAALSFLAWALVEYHVRMRKITSRGAAGKVNTMRLGWAGGPLAVLFIVACVMGLTLAGTLLSQRAVANDDPHDDHNSTLF